MTVKPDLTRVWADGAPGGNVVDPDITTPGKFEAGWVAEVPPFEHFNFLQQLFTQALAHASEQGIMSYDAVTDYPVDGMAKGSNGITYSATTANGPTSSVVNPVGDSTGTWRPAFALNASSIRTVTSDASAMATDRLIVLDGTSNSIDFTLLSAGSILAQGLKIQRSRSDMSSNKVTITTTGGGTIGGGATLELLAGEGYELIPDGVSDYLQFT